MKWNDTFRSVLLLKRLKQRISVAYDQLVPESWVQNDQCLLSEIQPSNHRSQGWAGSVTCDRYTIYSHTHCDDRHSRVGTPSHLPDDARHLDGHHAVSCGYFPQSDGAVIPSCNTVHCVTKTPTRDSTSRIGQDNPRRMQDMLIK